MNRRKNATYLLGVKAVEVKHLLDMVTKALVFDPLHAPCHADDVYNEAKLPTVQQKEKVCFRCECVCSEKEK